VRVAAMKAWPTDVELAADGFADAGAFMIKLRAGGGEGRLGWLESHAPHWDAPLPQPVHRALEHLISYICRLAHSGEAGDSSADDGSEKPDPEVTRRLGKLSLAFAKVEKAHPDAFVFAKPTDVAQQLDGRDVRLAHDDEPHGVMTSHGRHLAKHTAAMPENRNLAKLEQLHHSMNHLRKPSPDGDASSATALASEAGTSEVCS